MGLSFFSWIPHLNTSFADEIDIRVFRGAIKRLMMMEPEGIRVHVRDGTISKPVENKLFDGHVTIKFDISPDYRYGSGFTRALYLNKENCIITEVCVNTSGLIKIDVREIQGNIKDWDESWIRICVREIYFLLKKLFHEDIYHQSEDIHNSNMNRADDLFSIIKSDNENAMDELFHSMINKFRGICRVHGMNPKRKNANEELLKLAKGYTVFIKSFILSCVDPNNRNHYLETLDINIEAIEGYIRFNRDVMTTRLQMTINKLFIPISVLSMLITMLAGSLFYGIARNESEILWNGFDGGSIVFVIFCILTIAIPFFLLEYYKRKNKLK